MRSLLLATLLAITAQAAPPTNEFPLWPAGQVPGALGTEPKDTPTLTPYYPAPEKATGAAMVVFPGGGYRTLAAHEGEPYAQWLNDKGITAFVLKYRLYPGGYHQQQITLDAHRAVRYVRANAADWKLDPKRIAVIGSSAGGHMAAVLSTQFTPGDPNSPDPIERVSSRPDTTLLCYGFILFDKRAEADPAKRVEGLGENASDELVLKFSPARSVRADTPPTFIWQTVEDDKVVVENALTYASALQAAKIPFSLQLFQKGKHGIGLGAKPYSPTAELHPWTRDAEFWLKEHGFLTK
jgi:acetyl esterase/lipase